MSNSKVELQDFDTFSLTHRDMEVNIAAGGMHPMDIYPSATLMGIHNLSVGNYIMIKGKEGGYIQIKREPEGYVIDVFPLFDSTESTDTMTVWDTDLGENSQ